MSRILNCILPGIVVGSTATLIGYYGISLPQNAWIPWKARRNILGTLYTLYALFFCELSMTISQGSLFGIKLDILPEHNLVIMIFGSFLVGMYMAIGWILDKAIADNPRSIWLGLVLTSSVYFCIVGIAFNYLFLLSLAVFRIVGSVILGPILLDSNRKAVLALRIEFLVLNLLVLPVAAILSK